MINGKDVLDALKSPEIPEKPSVTVHIVRGGAEDSVRLSQCVDPVFDMQILAEGLATAIVIAAEYTQESAEKIFGEVTHNLHQAIRFHGKIERYDK